MDLKRAGQEFLSGYFSTHDRRTKTKTAYANDLKQFQQFAGEGLDLQSLSGTVIEQWAAHLRHEGYMPASMRRKIAVVKVFCSYWVRKGELRESPFWRVKLSIGRIQQLPKSLNERDMGALLTQAREHHAVRASYPKGPTNAHGRRATGATYRALRDWALVDLLFATGIRVGEASTLDIEDFAAQDGVFMIKGKEDAIVSHLWCRQRLFRFSRIILWEERESKQRVMHCFSMLPGSDSQPRASRRPLLACGERPE